MSLLTPIQEMLKSMGVNTMPSLAQNELLIELTEDDLKNALTKNVREDVKKAISVEIHEKKIILKVKLI